MESDKIRPSELSTLLDRYPSITTLSLDCFDTLFWRKAASPSDVFFALQTRPAFQSLGFTALLRANAETKARQMMLIHQGHQEVTLQDIYRESYPLLTQEQLAALEEEEITTEMEYGFAFTPTLELIREAHQRGLKIIIVSDTYFSEQQLNRLLHHVLPNDVITAIHQIVCSSEHRQSKINGLFITLLKKLSLQPEKLLHIGDNLNADYIAPPHG